MMPVEGTDPNSFHYARTQKTKVKKFMRSQLWATYVTVQCHCAFRDIEHRTTYNAFPFQEHSWMHHNEGGREETEGRTETQSPFLENRKPWMGNKKPKKRSQSHFPDLQETSLSVMTDNEKIKKHFLAKTYPGIFGKLFKQDAFLEKAKIWWEGGEMERLSASLQTKA